MSSNPNTTNPLKTNNKNPRKFTVADAVRATREAAHAARLEARGKKWTADPLVWRMNADALRGEEE